MQTSMYLPDDLYEELKARNAPVSRIARQACEDWLANDGDSTDPMTALRQIESAAEVLREHLKSTKPSKVVALRRKRAAS
jgi:hypothetical protein